MASVHFSFLFLLPLAPSAAAFSPSQTANMFTGNAYKPGAHADFKPLQNTNSWQPLPAVCTF
eukprot:1152131-Pelagomonas_calceolata.AAC.6